MAAQLEGVPDHLGRTFAAAAELLGTAGRDVTAFVCLPHGHWRQTRNNIAQDRLPPAH